MKDNFKFMKLEQQIIDQFFMAEAIRLAEQALEEGEIPVGAVVVAGERIIGKG